MVEVYFCARAALCRWTKPRLRSHRLRLKKAAQRAKSGFFGQNDVEVMNGSRITATTASGAPGFIGVTGQNISFTDTLVETDSMSPISGAEDFPSIGMDTVNGAGRIQLTNTTLNARVSGAGNSSGIDLQGLQVQLADSTVSASTTGAGDAGAITFRNGREISLSESRVTNSSTGSGAAGLVSLSARLEDGPIARAELVSPDAPDAGLGRIDVVNSSITSDTRDGAAGQVGLIADRVRVSGPSTQLSTNSTGSAAAGTLLLFGSSVSIDDGATVQSTASGTGNSNAVNIGAFDLNIGDRVSGRRTSISTNSLSSQGGDVVLRSVGVAQSVNADLVASAGAQGSGGNVQVNVDGGEFSVASSTLLAQAENGSGGVIDINPTPAAQIFIDGQSVLNADSATGTSGSVVVDSPDTGIVSALSQQEVELAPEARLEQDACSAASQTTSSSSLYVREAGNRDPFAGGYLGATGRSQSAQGDCQ